MDSQEPHKVQLAALAAVSHLPGAAYFMEQGLGKTRTLLMDFADKVVEGTCQRLVVICPNSFKGGWLDEIEKWGYDFDVFLWEAGNEQDAYRWLKRVGEKPPVLVMNYEAIRPKVTRTKKRRNFSLGVGQQFIADFVRDRLCMIGFDESIQISTFDSVQTHGALEITKWFNWQRDLSGKPIKTGPQDLWSQMRAIGALNGREYFPFRAAFCRMGGFMGKQVLGAQNEDILAELIDPYIFRATKADWTDLPPKIYSIREYKLSPEMRAKYKSMEEEFVLWLERGDAVTIDTAVTKYIKLAQIQAGFIFDNDSKTEWLVDDDHNPRLKALDEFIETELVGKIIVVANHRPVVDQLLRHYVEMKPAVIRGGMSTAEIENQKRIFNTGDDCRIIIITKAGKYGHTLLGNQAVREHACSTMAFYENTYSLDDRSQLEDRSHRHGQIQDTMDYIDFTGTPLDKNCVRSLQRKEGIFQSVFSKLTVRRQ